MLTKCGSPVPWTEDGVGDGVGSADPSRRGSQGAIWTTPTRGGIDPGRTGKPTRQLDAHA
eukprot:2998363-Pyramimonas_sp.AAC.1